MEKRAILAIVLSIIVLMSYQFIYGPTPQNPAPQATGVGNYPSDVTAPQAAPAEEAGATEASRETVPATPQKAPSRALAEEQTITVETLLYTAELSSIGGTINKWTLKEFKDDKGEPIELLDGSVEYRALGIGWKDDFSLSNSNFETTGRDIEVMGPGETGTVVFDLEGDGYRIKRTYTFRGDSYAFGLKDEVSGLPEYRITLGTEFGINEKESAYLHVGPVLLKETDRIEIKAKKLKETRLYSGDIKWVALEDKYFCSAIVPRSAMTEAAAWRKGDAAAISLKGQVGANEMVVYAGPKEADRIKALGLGLEHIVDYGFFSPIARPLFWLLKKLYGIVGNYGWAIIMLTIIVRVPFIPLVNKGQKSMKRMQELQPKMKEIRERYKKDQKQMQEEIMALYKRHKVNPMGGCLPMLVQIPVFFALYKMLLVSIELRGAPFIFWITDLSQKDPYYILPIVMGISMVVQQKMTPSAGDPKQQKMMMMMPVVFTFLFINFASGLVLYWLVNNLLSIIQQTVVNLRKTAE